MLGFRSWLLRGACLAALAVCSVSKADEPASGRAIPPRNNLYDTFSDAYINPDACGGGGQAGAAMNEAFLGPRPFKYYFGYDTVFMTRSQPGNKVLVRTSPNLFDGHPDQISADGATLFRQGSEGFFDLTEGRFRNATPNDASERFNIRNNEFLNPLDVRMATDDFDYSSRLGFRPTIGMEFGNGNRLEFTYFFVKDFKPATLVDDVSGAAFNTAVIGSPTPRAFAFQRMGYLNSPFLSTDGRLQGETRFTVPNPREPTFNDLTGNIVPVTPVVTTDPQNRPINLLFTDGELAVANYAFDIQSAELAYKMPIFEFQRKNWELTFIAALRWINVNESFNFIFADTTTNNAITSTTLGSFNQFASFSSPTVTAAISESVTNNILGPQIGLNARVPFMQMFELDLLGKAGYMANFMQKNQTVQRPDDLIIDRYEKNVTSGTGVVEGHVGLNFNPHPNIKLRSGYEFMTLLHMGTAIGNIEFDLDQRRRPANQDTVTYHGWFGGVEFVF